MDDTISRQAAIDTCMRDDAHTGYDAACLIAQLPSAQPERLTDDDFETIRIHLNAYKEKLCNQQRWEEAEEYQRIIDRFMAFASAQPETCEDAVSRKAVLEVFMENADRGVLAYTTAWRNIKDLPSVAPKQKTGEWVCSYKGTIAEGLRCSVCGKHGYRSNFCPVCGAKGRV